MDNSKNNKRILLVEDDRFLRRACEGSLRQRGFTVLTAVDGEEGLRLARAEGPDLILLDILMPKLPGLAMLRALKADEGTRAIPVLILSNSSRAGDRREALDLGAVGYLVKANLSLQELGEQVTRLLEGRGDGGADGAHLAG
jgi:CheY-like chemotaxis protein